MSTAVAVLLAGLLAACGSETSPSSAVCDAPVPARGSGAPLDTVRVAGIPPEMGDSLYAEVRVPDVSEDSLFGAAVVRRRDSTSVLLAVPPHPTYRLEGGPVRVTVRNRSVACEAFAFTVDSVVPAPGTLSTMVEDLQGLMDLQLRLAGLEPQALAGARPDTLPDVLVPFVALHRVLDGADNPHRLTGIDRSSGESRASARGGTPAPDLANAMLAHSGIPAMIRERLAAIRRLAALRPPDQAGWLEVLGRSGTERRELAAKATDPGRRGDAARRQRRARPTHARRGPALFASAGPTALAVAVPTAAPSAGSSRRASASSGYTAHRVPPAMLSLMMDLAFFSHQTPRQKQMLDAASLGYATSAALLSVAGAGASGAAKARLAFGSDRFSDAALAVWFANSILEMMANMLPSELVDLRIETIPQVYEEDRDQEGRFTRIDAVAMSNGHTLDQFVADVALQGLLEGNGVIKEQLLKGRGVTDEVVSETIDFVQGEVLGDVVSDAAGGEGVLRRKPELFVADVRDPRWSQIYRASGSSVRMTDDLSYRPVDVGSTEFRVFTKPTIMRENAVERHGMAAVFSGVFGFQQIRKSRTIEVRPIDVRLEPPAKRVTPGERVAVTAEVHDAVDGDLRWSVERGAGWVEEVGRPSEHRHEVEVVIPDPFEETVVVKATSTADRSHLRSSVYERAAVARFHDEEIDFSEACDPGTMERAIERASGTPTVMVQGGTFRNSEAQRPDAGSMRISGLVLDDGVACSHHVAAYVQGMTLPFMGGRGNAAMGEALEQAKRLQELAGEVADGGNLPGQMGEEARRRLRESVEAGKALSGPDSTEEFDAVFQLYSPNGQIWQSGVLGVPRLTKHTLLGGWRSNAAALISIQLPGTSADEIEAGESYEAVAVTGSPEGGLQGTSPVAPTSVAFYTWWRGDLAGVPFRSAEEREMCLRSRQQMEQMGLTEHLAGLDKYDCSYAEYAFQGVTHTLTGRLEGTVTVDSVARQRVFARFSLRGEGELQEVRYEFRRTRQGQVVGDRRVGETTRSGPIQIQGTIRAPNRRANAPRMVGLQTVVVPSEDDGR